MPHKQNPGAGQAAGAHKSDLLGGGIEVENSPSLARSQAARRSRRKGARVELELVHLHRKLGIAAEKVPLSGATHYQGSGHDIDVMAFGPDAAPLCCEVKARKGGAGFTTLEKWLGINDALFLKRNNAEPLIVLPFRVWAQLLDKASKR